MVGHGMELLQTVGEIWEVAWYTLKLLHERQLEEAAAEEEAAGLRSEYLRLKEALADTVFHIFVILSPVLDRSDDCPSDVLNSSDKSKSEASKDGDLSAPPKVGQQSSSQLINQALHTPDRSDIPKTSQAGNFQVLNQERNDISPVAKDGPKRTNQSASIPEPSCVMSSSNSEKLGPQISGISSSVDQEKENFASNSDLDCSVANRNDVRDACQELERNYCSESFVAPPDEEEAAFLRSLGWEENAGEEGLTAEEIDEFFKKNGELRPSWKLSHRELQPLKVMPVSRPSGQAGSSSALSSSNSSLIAHIDYFFKENEEPRPSLKLSHRELQPLKVMPVSRPQVGSTSVLSLFDSPLTAVDIDDFFKENGELRPSWKLSHPELQPLKVMPVSRPSGQAGSSSALSSSNSSLIAHIDYFCKENGEPRPSLKLSHRELQPLKVMPVSRPQAGSLSVLSLFDSSLTAVDIDDFFKENGELRPSWKLTDRELQPLKKVMPVSRPSDQSGSSSASSSSKSELEA